MLRWYIYEADPEGLGLTNSLNSNIDWMPLLIILTNTAGVDLMAPLWCKLFQQEEELL